MLANFSVSIYKKMATDLTVVTTITVFSQRDKIFLYQINEYRK